MTRAMKDSGIEWIGAIPVNWKIEKGKYCLSYLEKPVKQTDEVITCFRDGEVTLRKNRREDGFTISDKEIGYQGIDAGDLVVHGMDGFAGAIGISDSRGKASSVLNVLDTNQNKTYIMYYLRSMAYNGVFLALTTGIRVRTCDTNWRKLKELPYLLPDREEQDKIVNCINRQVSQTNEIILGIQEQITTLEEYKKSVISEAVTKGLNPNAEMKDSGIEWIGKIPANWEIKRTKYLASSISKGNGITKEDVNSDGNIQCIRYGEIYSKYKNCFLNAISATNLNKISSPKHIFKGDILFAGTGELVEEIGKNIVYLGDKPCLAGGDIIILRHHQNCKFLNYALYSSYAQLQKSIGKAKLKVVHISSTDIGNIYVALPSPTEQQEIADYLDSQCSQVEEAIADKQKQIETLEEYKKTLIYEYVTGKKEVA